MTTVAQAGIFGFGPSAGKGQGVADGDWYRHKGTLIDLAVLDDQRLGPPEVGGRPLPTIPYKAGVMGGGGATINPRLEGSIGWLLKGALGWSNTTAGSGAVNTHTFKIDDSNPAYVPYMGFRKFIPDDGDPSNYSLGETFEDGKLLNFMFTLPNDGLISARMDARTRLFTLSEDPAWGTSSGSGNGWAAEGEFEDYPSIPISSTPGGYINVPTFGNLPVIQCRVGIQNQPLDVRMEKVYGSPYLQDITVVGRQVSIELVVKWDNPDLYRQILTGSTTGTSWSAKPFTTAIDFRSLSPDNMPSEAQPYELQVAVTEAMLALQGGIELAGNNAVTMTFAGTALDVTGDYVVFTLVNQFSGYTWPS